MVNAATSEVGRSSEGPICVEPAWGNTGARAAMGVTGRCRGTPRDRLWTGRAVNCPRELKNFLTSSSGNNWVTLLDGLGRAFRGSTGTER